MEPTREAEDALFALLAVKQDFVSESAVEKALSKQAREEGEKKSLQRLLVEAGALTLEQAKALKEQLDPEIIEGYRIEGEAGRGGMGVVYKARQLSMDRLVAVKVLSRRLSSDETFVAKFLTEAKSAAKLNHENIVAAINAGECNGLNYFVMEFVDGESVADQLDRGVTFDCDRAFEIAEQVARGLAHAHGAGLVHRDVKPENVMITSDGRVKLCDLGLAKPAQEAGTGEKSSTTEGTPYYCSPEQALGRTDIDPRSDIYSLGTTLYHMLAGEPPFDGETARAIMVKQVRAPFPNLEEKLPGVPPAHRKLLAAMVVKDREGRLESVRAFEEKLLLARREAGRSTRGSASGGRRRNVSTLIGVLAVFLVFAGVGAGISLAVIGDETAEGGAASGGGATAGGGDDGASSTGTGGTSTGGTSTGGAGTGGTSISPPPDGDDGLTGPLVDDGSDPELAAARKLFKEARDHQDAHPDDPWGAHQRFGKVTELYPTSPIARQAEAEMAALGESLATAGSRALEDLAMRILSLLEQGEFKQAREAVDGFEAAWKKRRVPKLDARIARLRSSIDQQAGARLGRVLAKVDASETGAVDELSALAKKLPAGKLATQAQQRLSTLLEQRAQASFQLLMTQVGEALADEDARRARSLLTDAQADPALKPVHGKIDQALNDLSAQGSANEAYKRSIQALPTRGQVTLRLMGGEQLEGRWASTDARAWTGVFEVGGQPRPLNLVDLAPAELLSLGLPEAQGRANALVLLARGAPLAASAALQAWSRVSGKADPALAARIETEGAKVAETRAADLITRLADPQLDPAEAVAGIKAFPAELRATTAYRNRFELLKLAFQKARGSQLAADEAGLFRGHYEKDRKDRVTLTYDFSDPAQADDFLLDKGVDPDSRREVQESGLVVSGKVLHVARFAGGELKVDVRAVPRNTGNANVNLLLSSEPGWAGQLCGGGFQYGALKQIKIDAAAKKKGGYVVDLPASVFLVLDGKKPRMRMQQVLAAEESPTIKDRRTRFVVGRSSKGKVKLKIGSRTVYSVEAAPGWDAAGAVGLSPFSSVVVVEELEITGRLDEGWAQERGRQLAAAEAQALPPPASR